MGKGKEDKVLSAVEKNRIGVPVSTLHAPSFREMELFLCVVQNGSFSAAGRQIGLSPASVSRHINGLEDKLGVRLLNRTSRRLSLSDSGVHFYERATTILDDVRAMSLEISEEHRSLSGVLRVHCRILVGEEHIAPALPGFFKLYPDIQVHLTLSNEIVDLVEQNIDVDIRIGQLADSALIARKLVTSERILCASATYLNDNPEVKKPEDLLLHNCLAYRTNMGDVVWRFLDHERTLTEIPVDGSLLTNSGPVLKIAAISGLGLALMPEWSIREELRQGDLIRLLPDHKISFTSFENGVFAVYSPTRHLPVKARVFIDYLARIFQDNHSE